MSTIDLHNLLPLLILAGSIVITLAASAFFKKSTTAFVVTLAGMGAALVAFLVEPTRAVTNSLLITDGLSVFYSCLILISSLAMTLLSKNYFQRRPSLRRENEYYLLLLMATLGSIILVESHHFASFFLGLEILSISLYVLISYQSESERGFEAGTKYLILAGTSSAFLLFGMALVYFFAGTMDFAAIGAEMARRGGVFLPLLGFAMIFVGIGFKLSWVPFHTWAPDIYEGAPAPISGFIATVSKGAVFALLIRYFLFSRAAIYPSNFRVLSAVAIASMLVGNLLALRQKNIKRLLAYSSIAHMGYLLVALLASSLIGVTAATFYLAIYVVTSLITFGVVSVLSEGSRDADRFEDFQGFFWKKPLWALIFSFSLLSLAGLPLTAGFVAKFYLVTAGISGTLWSLVAVLVAGSVISLYYYLGLIVVMFAPSPTAVTAAVTAESTGKQTPRSPSRLGLALLTTLTGVLLWLGLYPSPVLNLITVLQKGLALAP